MSKDNADNPNETEAYNTAINRYIFTPDSTFKDTVAEVVVRFNKEPNLEDIKFFIDSFGESVGLPLDLDIMLGINTDYPLATSQLKIDGELIEIDTIHIKGLDVVAYHDGQNVYLEANLNIRKLSKIKQDYIKPGSLIYSTEIPTKNKKPILAQMWVAGEELTVKKAVVPSTPIITVVFCVEGRVLSRGEYLVILTYIEKLLKDSFGELLVLDVDEGFFFDEPLFIEFGFKVTWLGTCIQSCETQWIKNILVPGVGIVNVLLKSLQ